MFHCGDFLYAIVDVDATITDHIERKASRKPSCSCDIPLVDDVPDTAANLSNRQRQKQRRKLRKQKAIEINRLKASDNDPDKAQPFPSPTLQPLRLHEFVSTCFRSELNIAENGVGVFIQNAPRVSAHHAILNGVVRVNGIVTKVGSKILDFGDLVSLEINASSMSHSACRELVSWKGSEDVAKKLEHQRDYGEWKGRMATSLTSPLQPADVNSKTISQLSFVQYYRTKLGRLWLPSINEVAIMNSLPMTLRVLKNSTRLENELRAFGFRQVMESDVSFQLSHSVNAIAEYDDGVQMHQTNSIDCNIMKEFLSNAWIMDQEELSSTSEKEGQVGVFLSEARLSGEILQQELNSMMPVSILSSILKERMMKEQTQDNSSARPMHFLDLCAAPGSKTCQLITVLDKIQERNEDQKNDFVIVANELNPSRATQLRQRCFQQCGNRSLTHLVITNTDGRKFDNIDKGQFDFVVCDVPCSGDGTIRRSPDLLHKWSTKNAEKNKPIQKGLLKVALEMLRPGGIVLYSTCSLNPVENDDVVEETLCEMNNTSDNEYSLLNLEKRTGGSCCASSYLRILPASSHGGFFVAAIRRKDSGNDRGSKMSLGVPVEIEWKKTQKSNRSIAYAASTSTKIMCKQISERLNINPISCGVPVMYRENDENCPFILQEGCAALDALGSGIVSVAQLSSLQLRDCATTADGRSLCIPKNLFIDINVETTALIIRVKTDKETASLLLPAKISRKRECDDASHDYIKVELLARPQLRRIICCK